MAAELHVGDWGTLFEVLVVDEDDVLVDVSIASGGVTTAEIEIRRPNAGSKITYTAGYKTDGTDGILTMIIGSTDFDVEGWWTLQVFIETASGAWRSEVIEFQVVANI